MNLLLLELVLEKIIQKVVRFSLARKKKRTEQVSSAKGIIKHPPKALTSKQSQLIEAIHHKDMIVALGPAGTGKTYLSAMYAGYYYKLGKVKRIVLTRPTVATGKSIGFFPGTLEEKMEPWVHPFKTALEEYLGKSAVETMIKKGSFEIVPFEVIRGRTFDDAFVILDEAQNCTKLEMKAFVTRQGEGSTVVVNGDMSQSDLNGNGNGLEMISNMIRKSVDLKNKVSIIEFTYDDIVRSDLCKLWVREFSKNEV